MQIQYKLTAKSINSLLYKTFFILFSLHFFASLAILFVKNKTVLAYVTIFYFDAERNLPTTYSAVAILFASYWLWQISKLPDQKTRKNSIFWMLLSFVFIFLAADEYTSIHEHAGHVLKLFTDKVFPFQGWYIPVVVLLALITPFFLRFFFRLDKITRIRFVIAGLIFIGGAVVVEVISAYYYASASESLGRNIILVILITIEESMEMIGIIIFINALIKFYLNHEPDNKFKLDFKIKKEHKFENEYANN